MLTGKKKKLLSEKAELAKTMNKYFTNLEKYWFEKLSATLPCECTEFLPKPHL